MLSLTARRLIVAVLVVSVCGTPVLAATTKCCRNTLAARSSDADQLSCCCGAKALPEERSCCQTAEPKSCCAAAAPETIETRLDPARPCCCKSHHAVPAVTERRARFEGRSTLIIAASLPSEVGVAILGGAQVIRSIERFERPLRVALPKLLCRWTV